MTAYWGHFWSYSAVRPRTMSQRGSWGWHTRCWMWTQAKASKLEETDEKVTLRKMIQILHNDILKTGSDVNNTEVVWLIGKRVRVRDVSCYPIPAGPQSGSFPRRLCPLQLHLKGPQHSQSELLMTRVWFLLVMTFQDDCSILWDVI